MDRLPMISPLHLERQTKVSIVRLRRNFEVTCLWSNGRLPSREFEFAGTTQRDASRRRSRITGARKSRLFRPFDVVLRSRCLYFPHRYHRWQVDRKCLAREETISQNCMTHRGMISRESISQYESILYIYILYTECSQIILQYAQIVG